MPGLIRAAGATPMTVTGTNLTLVVVVAVIAVVALIMGVVFRRQVLAADPGTAKMQIEVAQPSPPPGDDPQTTVARVAVFAATASRRQLQIKTQGGQRWVRQFEQHRALIELDG